MADVQIENGYVRIANQLLEALSISEFTATERRVLDLCIRLSYGCRKKTVTFNQWNDLCIIGIDKSYIRKLLTNLQINKVIFIDENSKSIMVNKNFDEWKIRIVDGYDPELYKAMIAYNLSASLEFTTVKSSLPELNSILPESNPVYSGVELSLLGSQTGDANQVNDSAEVQPPKDILLKTKKERSQKEIDDFVSGIGTTLNEYWSEHHLPNPYMYKQHQIIWLREMGELSNYNPKRVGKYALEALAKKLLDDDLYEYILTGLRGEA